MVSSTSAIDTSVTVPSIDALLGSIPLGVAGSKRRCRYSQSEDPFLLLEEPLEIPSFPVHHDFRDTLPPPGYTEAIALIADRAVQSVPWLLAGTRWYFDPVNIHNPAFYRVEILNNRAYLYLARLDLACRPLESEILEEGSNNRTQRYRSRHLYFESDWYPLARMPESDRKAGKSSLEIEQTIPVTWKGESGEGYMIHGIWMDSDINKFFSKLVLPPGRRNHPFYPVTCKHRCVSVNALGLEPGRSSRGPAVLQGIMDALEPELDDILEDLQAAPFSELLPLFREIKARIDPALGDPWSNLQVTASLNEREHKEYSVEF